MLFISAEMLNEAKFGVLCGTIVAGILGYLVLHMVLPAPPAEEKK